MGFLVENRMTAVISPNVEHLSCLAIRHTARSPLLKKFFGRPHLFFFSTEPVFLNFLKTLNAVDLLHPICLPIAAYESPAKRKCFIATRSLSDNSRILTMLIFF